MTANGLEIADAIDNVAATCPNPKMVEALDEILDSIGQGETLSGAVHRCGDLFPPSVAPLIKAAEATASVPDALSRICIRMRSELQMRGTIVGAMVYPLLLIGTSLVVLSALIFGVLPQFGAVFESMGRDVPTPTAVLLSVGSFARENMTILGLSLGGLIFGLVWLRNHPWVMKAITWLLMKTPGLKGAYQPLLTGRTFRTIAAMVGGGVPLLESIQLTRQSTMDPSWQALLDEIGEALMDGRQASEVMEQADFLPAEASALMATGQATGRVAEVLEDVGSFYEEEASRRIKKLITLFEPAIILSMGVVVAGIVLSVMLPLMDISTIQS